MVNEVSEVGRCRSIKNPGSHTEKLGLIPSDIRVWLFTFESEREKTYSPLFSHPWSLASSTESDLS